MLDRLRHVLLASLFVLLLSGCIVTKFTVGDFVWEDTNGNGIQDIGEIGIGNVIVFLFGSNDNDDEPSIFERTVTNSEGHYEFNTTIPDHYYLEFIDPEGRQFTLFEEGEDGAKDSDVRPFTDGRTKTFDTEDVDTLEVFSIDAGLLPIVSPVPVGTPTVPFVPPPTNTPSPPTPSSTPILDDPFADDEKEVEFEDPMNDEFICSNSSSVSDPEVDLTTVKAEWSFGRFVITVNRKAPLSRDFSFAVLVLINQNVAGQERVYLWELHDGFETIAELYPATGQPVDDPEGNVLITHDRQSGAIVFDIAGETLPEFVDTIEVLSFHTPVEGDEKNCDEAGIFFLPESMQKVPK